MASQKPDLPLDLTILTYFIAGVVVATLVVAKAYRRSGVREIITWCSPLTFTSLMQFQLSGQVAGSGRGGLVSRFRLTVSMSFERVTKRQECYLTILGISFDDYHSTNTDHSRLPIIIAGWSS